MICLALFKKKKKKNGAKGFFLNPGTDYEYFTRAIENI